MVIPLTSRLDAMLAWRPTFATTLVLNPLNSPSTTIISSLAHSLQRATQAHSSSMARVIWLAFSTLGYQKAGVTMSPMLPLPGGSSSNSNSSIHMPTSTAAPSKHEHYCQPPVLPSPCSFSSTTRFLPLRIAST